MINNVIIDYKLMYLEYGIDLRQKFTKMYLEHIQLIHHCLNSMVN